MRGAKLLIALAAVVLVVGAEGCAHSQPTSVEVPALVTGRLAGDPATGCVFVVGVEETPGAKPEPGKRSVVQWPQGVQPRTDPVRLLGAAGDIIAREGDKLELSGSSSKPAAVPDRCSDKNGPPDFFVNKIERVTPATG